jgi:transcriptional regulator with XRE-family HTH domain
LRSFFEQKSKVGVIIHPSAFLVPKKRKDESNMFKNNYDVKEFGARIREIRKASKMTQEDLANRLMLTAESISNMESGKTNCMPEHIVHICEMFDVTTDYLYFGIENQKQVKADTDELSALLSDCSAEELERVTQMVKLFLRK